MDKFISPVVIARATSADLTRREINVVIALERTGAALSLFGVTLIFITYWAFLRLRTTPNLFIVFASIANVGASIACAMGYDGIRAGERSSSCQAQAFLLEMFMQSDPWWSFAMAVNVFLVFFANANPAAFRRYLWVYCLVCFGIPSIPAFLGLFLRPDGPNDYIYGDATLWCWINSKYSKLRIYTYYLPVWCCIFGSTIIYSAVGYHVFHHRNQLHNLTFSGQRKMNSKGHSYPGGRDSTEKNVAGRTEFYYGTAVTEVQIVTMTPRPWVPQLPSRVLMDGSASTDQRTQHERPWRTSDDLEDPPSPRFETTCTSSPLPPEPRRSFFQRVGLVRKRFCERLRRLDSVKLAYLRTSFIFAISVLVTWTPSSINRIFNLVRPTVLSFPLTVASATVLPLQGVWNAVIFFATSWSTFKEEWVDWRSRHPIRLDNRAKSRIGGFKIQALQGDQRDHVYNGRHGHTQAAGSHNTSELELTSPTGLSNVRAMRGSFTI
ncbi:Cyclic AMP receptor-like protein A 2 [Colletotrichum chlorophyti]|uniref:Cyclic AMP receptor-like protein A 2 n=1 Tax=Colletotrichum chlorophyti TaxID=708187 RepID=A0A1Q8RZL0_9PEZI|nr:Cyclic AMP receptor-like protein A 2 [Colletotrichum chlorophyti]